MFGLGLIAELQWDRQDIVCVLRLECEQFPEEWSCCTYLFLVGGAQAGARESRPAQETTPFSPYFNTSSHSQSSYSGKRCISENPFSLLLLLFFFISDYKSNTCVYIETCV